jgi:hypothetical protein
MNLAVGRDEEGVGTSLHLLLVHSISVKLHKAMLGCFTQIVSNLPPLSCVFPFCSFTPCVCHRSFRKSVL